MTLINIDSGNKLCWTDIEKQPDVSLDEQTLGSH